MEIRTGYANDPKLRQSFTVLAQKTFGIDLETWYERGFWQDEYIPYSVICDGSVVSNVSVSVCNLKWKKRVHHLAQLGCVMTDEKYRGQGMSRMLMEKVTADCKKSFEGVFLYAEEKMTGFYEKFGFKRIKEYRCIKKVNITNVPKVENIPMDSKEEWDRMVDIIQRRSQYGEHIMVNNPGLFMFYLTGPFSRNVYYIPSCEAYAVASLSDDTLTLYAVFSDEKVSLGELIPAFGSAVKHVVMAFTPENNTGFEMIAEESEDSVLLAQGEVFENIGSERFMIPEIART